MRVICPQPYFLRRKALLQCAHTLHATHAHVSFRGRGKQQLAEHRKKNSVAQEKKSKMRNTVNIQDTTIIHLYRTDLLFGDGSHRVVVTTEHRHHICEEPQRRQTQFVLFMQRRLAEILGHLQRRQGVEQQAQHHDGLAGNESCKNEQQRNMVKSDYRIR